MAVRLKIVDRDTPMMLPPDIREWIPKDHIVLFIIEAVALMGLKGFKVNASGSGSEQYSPNMMLVLLIYCYATGRFSSRQIEAARRAIIRYLKKGGKLWIRIFPDKPITRKGVEVPMGGGKGSVEFYAYPIKKGRIIFELSGIDETIAQEAFRKASDKLPIKTKFIKR